MSKAKLLIAAAVACLTVTGCATSGKVVAGNAAAGNAAPSRAVTYTTIVEGFDWGPAITRVVIDFGRPILASSVDASDFSVAVERKHPASGDFVQDFDWATMKGHDSKGERAVVGAYLSDPNGVASKASSGEYVAIELRNGPTESLGSPFNYDFKSGQNSYIDVLHTIAMKGSVIAADGNAEISQTLTPAQAVGVKTPLVDRFDTTGVSVFDDPRYGKITLRYASFSPKADGKKHPLVIWLHGAGEGGTDPRVAILGNRVTALIEDHAQSIFGGAYVLAPQTPIVWMNNGVKSYPEDGTTQYTASLMRLIENYVAANPDIDTARLYIGGCSNGGYMTMNMIMTYPGYFAAAYPVCEAYADKWISDERLATIKDMPIWFTQAKTDVTVNAAAGGFVLDTYKRLVAAGAKDVHLTYWDSVVDLSGKWKKADGTPYEYFGHWSWIYALNDACRVDFDGGPVTVDGKAVSLMQWLAAQKRK